MVGGMVLERQLRVLHLGPCAAGRDSEPLGLAGASESSPPPRSDTPHLTRLYLTVPVPVDL